eukprot:TRINITY_DN3784_c0_g1_i1.p1 TRINITY_DN3784_c0_g1~~TRINITY_DN3784_c0_g1_i1.p1  ORF type:complete len:310 (+),score=76.88 TRINITY_DN3784_c0_g1_i1:85-930(+)
MQVRPSHFVGIKITDPSVIGNLVRIQDQIRCPRDMERIPPTEFHITLFVLHLGAANPEDDIVVRKQWYQRRVRGTQRDQNQTNQTMQVRPSHFVGIKITDPSVIGNLVRIQDQIRCPRDMERIPPTEFHITLFVLHLGAANPEDDIVVRALNACNVEPLLKDDLIIDIEGVSAFGKRVVHAGVKYNETLRTLNQKIQQKFLECGVNVIEDKRDWHPHITLFKSRNSGSYGIDEYHWKPFETDVFGTQFIHECELLKMGAKDKTTNYYYSLGKIALREKGMS